MIGFRFPCLGAVFLLSVCFAEAQDAKVKKRPIPHVPPRAAVALQLNEGPSEDKSPKGEEKREIAEEDPLIRETFRFSSESLMMARGISPHDGKLQLVSPDGKYLVSFPSNEGATVLFDLRTKKKVANLPIRNNNGWGFSWAFSPDGKFLVTTEMDQYGGCSVDLWDLPKGTKHRNLDDDVNTTPFSCVAFTPDGHSLAFGTGLNHNRNRMQPTGLHFWKVASGEETRQIILSPAPDENNVPQMIGMARLNFQQTLSLATLDGLALAPNGKSCVVVHSQKVLLLELLTGKERGLLGTIDGAKTRNDVYNGYNLNRTIRQISYSPDGRYLALLTNDGILRLWDVPQERELQSLFVEDFVLGTFYFHADSSQIHALSLDQKLFTWTLDDTRKPLPDLKALSPDDRLYYWGQLQQGMPSPALFAATRILASEPAATLAFLKDKIKPVAALDPRQTERILRDLQSSDFNQRKLAAAELRQLGELGLAVLIQAQNNNRQEEFPRKLFEKLSGNLSSPEQIQSLHGLRVLEQMGTSEALKFLDAIAQGAPESNLTQEAKRILDQQPKEMKKIALVPEKLWTDLGDANPQIAYRALKWFGQGNGLDYLRKKMNVIGEAFPDDSPDRLASLIADLDASSFPVREKATENLQKIGRSIEPLLIKTLEKIPTLEQKNRIDRILLAFSSNTFSAETMQWERGLEALERLGSAECRDFLASLRKTCKNQAMQATLQDILNRLGKS